MNKRFIVLLLFVLFAASFTSKAQVQLHNDGRYPYTTVDGDPTRSRIYKLNNGLTVFLTVYKNEPRIQTYIPIRAGSKNDPSDATGLAHYLEHMLFKGTDKYGSKDYEKEKPLVDEVINLFEDYRATTNEDKRKEIYRMIDSVSGLASKYAIANEYDKMMNVIGAKGTNAYTWIEQTVYTNDIPANQLEKWLIIESERFRNPVLRLFHTELEAVYEEKNISMDNDGEKAWDRLFLDLYPTHQYGTQTTIGTIDHLKNPSMKKVMNYFNTYYVPNNMAIALSGDLDPDKTIELIDKYWGSKPAGVVPDYIPPVEKPITSPIEREVTGPDAEYVLIGYRFPGANTKENDLVTMVDMLLSNTGAGLLDLNLNQKQKVLSSSSSLMSFKDYSTHVISGNPREGQSLEEVKALILEQIEQIKKGAFPDWLPSAIVSDLKLSLIKSFESNRQRAGALVNAFVKGVPWEDEVGRLERLSKITKQEIIDFANNNYSNNYALVYKRTGEDKNVQKVEKPAITPVEVNRQDNSPFLAAISEMQVEDLKPVFINFSTDLSRSKLNNDVPFLYKKNEENEYFSLSFVIDIGSDNERKVPLAASYFDYLGTSKYTAAELKQEFYKLGCTYSISSGEDETVINLSGLDENFEKSFGLLQSVLADVQPGNEALKNLISDILKVRTDNKLDRDKILWDAMWSYGKYGSKSSYTNILSEKELKSLDPDELITIIKSLPGYKHKVLYFGPKDNVTISAKLNQRGNQPATGLLEPPNGKVFTEKPTAQNTIYVVDYPEMVQAEILMLSKKDSYSKDLAPYISMYNEYFGGGMSSIIFQELRESKALAYSTFSSFSTPSKKDESFYNIAYIGTQADKLTEAMAGLFGILNTMPESEITFSTGKDNLIQKIRSERITKAAILNSFLASEKMGLDYDIREDIFNKASGMTIEDVKRFHQKNVKDSKYNILILGDKKKLDVKSLEKYGKVKFLSLEEIFGY
ncbi:MAG: insulinase family protein [Ignavibacteria bacterium]|nr:insulinase family protein [Ignavibacteria bacterium]